MASIAQWCEECFWWLKSKVVSSEHDVAEERARTSFDRSSKPVLVNGAVFEWVPAEAGSSSTASTLLSSAISNFSNVLGGGGSQAAQVGPAKPSAGKGKPVQVLLRLKLPEKTQGAPSSASMIGKIATLVTGDVTKLVWTSLELEKNKPKFEGHVDFHMVQTIKDEDSMLTLKDHQNNVLFQGKSQDAKLWNDLLSEAIRVLGPQLEDEAEAYRGVTYRSKRLERLEAKQKEWAEKRKKLGDVPMGYTAKVLMSRGDNVA